MTKCAQSLHFKHIFKDLIASILILKLFLQVPLPKPALAQINHHYTRAVNQPLPSLKLAQTNQSLAQLYWLPLACRPLLSHLTTKVTITLVVLFSISSKQTQAKHVPKLAKSDAC